ncbi:MAG: BamA/TamA family outer membrane protein [Pseudomonadota bacterium]|nr:BamA/TamA family outer membrane protein [Pseudomonadota bacterium]
MSYPRVALLAMLVAAASTAYGADPQSYRVEIASVDNAEMDATLKATSDLLALRGTAPVSPFGLIARARSDMDRLTTAIESFGYYQCAVTIKINGMLISNANLGEILTALPKGTDADVTVGFTLGPLYHLGRIELDGELPDSARGALGLTRGQPAVASAVLAGGARLQNALQEQGYAFAAVGPPVAYEAASAAELDLQFHAVVGPKVNIGQVHIEGLQRVHESLSRRRLLLKTGDPYSPSAIERARRDLMALGAFGQVSLQIGVAVDETGGVPVTFKIRERLRHAFSVSAGFSSDLGGSGGVKWTDRNVFGNAEQLTIAADVLNLGGSNTKGIGYDTSATYLIADFRRRDQSLQFAVGALKQSLQAYDQVARTSSVTLSRKLSSIWTASIGFATAVEQINQEKVQRNYTLVALPLVVGYDSTNLSSPLEDARHGMRASLSVTPTLAIGHPNALFIISQIKAATYYDLENLLSSAPGRTVLAARALVGLAQGAGQTSLPPDQRFYAGGSATIRGYAYQAVGPQFADGTPEGGTAITVGGLELRQRFGAAWGAAAFMDAGQVGASVKAARDEFRVGVGAGVRYFTPIGPIRFDVAVPTKRRPNDSAFEIYIGLGQAF